MPYWSDKDREGCEAKGAPETTDPDVGELIQARVEGGPEVIKIGFAEQIGYSPDNSALMYIVCAAVYDKELKAKIPLTLVAVLFKRFPVPIVVPQSDEVNAEIFTPPIPVTPFPNLSPMNMMG